MNYDDCIKASKALYKKLRTSGKLDNNLTLEPHQDSFCFRISGFNKHPDFNKLSISYPMDCNRHEVETIETAIFSDDKLVYIDELKYDDVRHFYSFDELIEEINRLI